MNLLNPTNLLWAFIALPILALYILKVRHRRQVVPTLMFWDQIYKDAAPRALWRRMRYWLSLLLQLALLALLTMALADPIRAGASSRPKHWVVMLDQSASMQATDGAPTRFDQARQIAHGIIRAMRARDQATVIGVGAQVTIASGRTHHQPTLHRAVDGLAPTDAPADLQQALAMTAAIDIGEEERALVVITDGPGAAQLDDPGDAVTIHRCGRDAANVAITGFAVRPRSDNPVELQGMLRVANYGPAPVSAEVQLKLDGELFDAVFLDLDPDQEKLHTFRHVHTTGHLLQAKLSAADALAVDNTAVAVLPEIREKRVALITEGNLFLASVLAAHPWMELAQATPAQRESVVQHADIVVFDRFVPDTLPDKPSFFLDPSGDSPLWTIGDMLNNPLVSEVKEDAALLRHVSLRNCTFHRARAVTPNESPTALVSSFEHPLLLSWLRHDPPTVLLAVDIRQSDLPWRTVFPILVQNTLNELAGQAAEPVSAYATGTTPQIAARASKASATDGQGNLVSVVTEDGRLAVGPVSDVGVVTVQADERVIDLAFNLADATESNIGANAADAADAQAVAAASLWSWPWWVILVTAAIALNTVEWGLHQRRRIE